MLKLIMNLQGTFHGAWSSGAQTSTATHDQQVLEALAGYLFICQVVIAGTFNKC